jgi:biotin carboxylase
MSSKEEPRMYLAIIEPHDIMFHYLEVAKRKGYQTLVVTSDAKSSRQDDEQYHRTIHAPYVSRVDRFITCDIGNVKSVVDALMPLKSQIAGIVAGHDILVPLTAEVGIALGFDYAPPEDATCQQLKTAMKRRLLERGVRTARFSVCASLEQAMQAWETFGSDCVVKMVNFVAGMNVFRVRSREEVTAAWDIIINNRRGINTPFPRVLEVLVEEYISGRLFTVEGYVQNGRIVVLNSCEELMGANFVMIGVLVPSDLPAPEQEKVNALAKQCVAALGVRNSVFHAEVLLMGGVPYIVECASRPPGLHAPELINRSRDLDLIDISIDLATGKDVTVVSREPHLHYALMSFYSQQAGILTNVAGLEELKARGGVIRIYLTAKVGDKVPAVSTFRDKRGFVILEDPTAQGVREKAAWMRKNVRLEVGKDVSEAVSAVSP